MPFADLDHVQIYYETSGPSEGAPLVMIHGLGAQMVAWYPGFLAMLEDAGFRLIRFDNRDVGLSTKFDGMPEYSLLDMADDVRGLMDHLDLQHAHILGQSMGGVIAQQFAISHPDRVQSLNIIYSFPGDGYIVDDAAVAEGLNREDIPDRPTRIADYAAQERATGLEGFDDAWITAFATMIVDRCYCPAGVRRQYKATRFAPSRLEALAEVRVPTSVIHGRSDAVISWKGGVDIAAAIPGAELFLFADMRHQIPPRLWPDFVRIVGRTAVRAGARLNGDFGSKQA